MTYTDKSKAKYEATMLATYGVDWKNILRRKQSEGGKKAKKVGKGYFHQLKQQGDQEKLSELSRRGGQSLAKQSATYEETPRKR